MEFNLILAGVGGQGILTIAQAVSLAAMRRGWFVKQAEVHGMSQRGGAVYSHLRMADHELFSDLIPQGRCDLVLAMEPVEALRYVSYLGDRGGVVANTAPFMNIPNYPALEDILERIARFGDHALVDAERLARAAGSPRAVNSVMLGAAGAFLPLADRELADAVAELFARKGPQVVEGNQRAFRLGRGAAAAYRDALRRGMLPREIRQRLQATPPEALAATNGKAPALGSAAGEGDVLSDAESHAVRDVLRAVHRAGRTQLFEHEVYRLVELVGAISPPRHEFIQPAAEITDTQLSRFAGDRVVLKVVSADVVHKSDVGGIVFVAKDATMVQREVRRLVEAQQAAGAVVEGVLLVECVEHRGSGLGGELFVGIRASREFGAVIAAGFGGIDTEYLAHTMKPGAATAMAPALDTSAEAFLRQFQETAAYEVLSGTARGHRREVSDGELLRCFRAFIALARAACPHQGSQDLCLEELEVNPFAFVRQRMVPLDGRGRLGDAVHSLPPRPIEKVARMLEPRSIAVVGVSGKRANFGRIIMDNIRGCGFPQEHLYVIKTGVNEIDGVQCVPSLGRVPEPVDMLVVTASPDTLKPLMDEVLASDRVASVILIPGGLGETEVSRTLEAQLSDAIVATRGRPDRGPVVLGGNCLGVRSRPGRYDTFFVPPDKLDPQRQMTVRPVALITQSGAFAITRVSNLDTLNPALAITIGNQTDLTASDLLRAVVPRDDIRVIGVYVEGFRDLDGLAFARAVVEATSAGKRVVFYKAGRTSAGRSATMGHTASIAGDYEVCRAVVKQAGAIVTETFKEFEQVLELAAAFHHKAVHGRRVAVISNAGFEAVGMADAIQGPRYRLEMATLSDATVERIEAVLGRLGLGALVSVRNPLDVNPMANEEVYETAIRALLEDPGVDAVAASIVPFTPQLRTTASEIASLESLAARIPELFAAYNKPLVVVVDAGEAYYPFARAMRAGGVPVMPSCDQAIRSLGRYLCDLAPAASSPDPAPSPDHEPSLR